MLYVVVLDHQQCLCFRPDECVTRIQWPHSLQGLNQLIGIQPRPWQRFATDETVLMQDNGNFHAGERGWQPASTVPKLDNAAWGREVTKAARRSLIQCAFADLFRGRN